MRACNPGVQTDVKPEGRGPSLTIAVTQPLSDVGGWILDVYARFSDKQASRVFINTLTLTAPTGTKRATRVVAIMTIPAAEGFFIQVVGPAAATNPNPIQVGAFVSEMTAFPFTTVIP